MATKMGKLDICPILAPPNPPLKASLMGRISARGLTISPYHGLDSALSMEKVNGRVEGLLRPRTNGKEQIFIPLQRS